MDFINIPVFVQNYILHKVAFIITRRLSTTSSCDYAGEASFMDLCMYITALNLLHLKGFLQFVRPENKARVCLFPYSSTMRVYGKLASWITGQLVWTPSLFKWKTCRIIHQPTLNLPSVCWRQCAAWGWYLKKRKRW